MGLFDALFGKKSETTSVSQDTKKYEQLIRFISFAKKIKPLTGGNYGIHISYDAPGQNECISRLYATLGFYDFDEIRFAREYAIGSSGAPVNMIQYYYKNISEQAGLTQQDWPYGIDQYDFVDVLRGTYCESYFTLIPDDYNDDIFTFKVVGGIDSRNAAQVSNAVINVLESQFPELQFSKNHTTPYSMGIKISI